MQQPPELTFNGVLQLAAYVYHGQVFLDEHDVMRILDAKADPEWVQAMERLINFGHVELKGGREYVLTAEGKANLERALPALLGKSKES